MPVSLNAADGTVFRNSILVQWPCVL